MSGTIVFSPDDLLPQAWRGIAPGEPVRLFNPALLREGDGWLYAYRVATGDGRRRIGICRLDATLQVMAESAQPWSDRVRFPEEESMPEVARHWFADPRLYRLGARVFIYWNSGWHEPRNWQFLQELDATTLAPVGAPRELVLRGERRKLEKNWTLFTDPASGRHHVVYSILPHRILEVSLEGDGPLVCEDAATTEWRLAAYPQNHGGLRGGAPPVLAEGSFWGFCHSVHDGDDGYRYAPALYRFAAAFPFRPVDEPISPIPITGAAGFVRAHPRLNPAVGAVIYPCGAACVEDGWLVSHGINDEQCAITRFTREELVATLRPLPPS